MNDDLKWQDNAACRNLGPDQFYQEGRGYPNYTQIKRLCRRCPVQTDCLNYGLNEEYGIWGGLTPAERQKVRLGLEPTTARIVELARQGMDDATIAETLGMNVKTVARRRYNAGIIKSRGRNRISQDNAA